MRVRSAEGVGPWKNPLRNGTGFSSKRTGRDSNPRYRYNRYAGLANRYLQPLGHLSGSWIESITSTAGGMDRNFRQLGGSPKKIHVLSCLCRGFSPIDQSKMPANNRTAKRNARMRPTVATRFLNFLLASAMGRLQIRGFVSFLKPDHTHAGASSGES